MKTVLLLAALSLSLSASAEPPTAGSIPHKQAFACSLKGCSVTCPTVGRVPAVQFKANALTLTVLPSRVAVFDAVSGVSTLKTYLVDLSERNCEIEQ